ncbi:hypothetical protein ASC97_24020 [Rhizobium sp. Root1203]|nr:hypothetical protein ASC97_24020 [Rhizobium sp. Root1203]
MEDAKNTNCRLGNGINRNVRRALDHKFARTSNSANAPARGEIDQVTSGGHDPLIDQDGG